MWHDSMMKQQFPAETSEQEALFFFLKKEGHWATSCSPKKDVAVLSTQILCSCSLVIMKRILWDFFRLNCMWLPGTCQDNETCNFVMAKLSLDAILVHCQGQHLYLLIPSTITVRQEKRRKWCFLKGCMTLKCASFYCQIPVDIT